MQNPNPKIILGSPPKGTPNPKIIAKTAKLDWISFGSLENARYTLMTCRLPNPTLIRPKDVRSVVGVHPNSATHGFSHTPNNLSRFRKCSMSAMVLVAFPLCHSKSSVCNGTHLVMERLHRPLLRQLPLIAYTFAIGQKLMNVWIYHWQSVNVCIEKPIRRQHQYRSCPLVMSTSIHRTERSSWTMYFQLFVPAV